MSEKIVIDKKLLNKLYTSQQRSTYKIAKKFNCDPSVIQKRLKENGIKLRSPKKRIIIPKGKLHDLYINQKLSTQKISKILGISSCSVYYKLKEFGINLRKKNIFVISKEDLMRLYINQNLSCSAIAKKFNCNTVTIFNKLKKYHVKTRNYSLACTKYPKNVFDGNDNLKAYMIGFRLGDLNIRARNADWTIVLRSNTTKEEQVDLIKRIYGKYGHFNLKDYNGVYHIFCNLDKSFNFLLKKEDKIEEWIFIDNRLFLSFLGGYSDAEGSFGIYDNRAKFRVGSYDKCILKQIADKLNSMGIIAKFNLESKAVLGKHNKDFYRVSINEKASLLKFIQLIKPYLQHKKRYNDMLNCEKNIFERNKKYEKQGFIMKDKKTFYITTTIPYANAPPHIGFALEIVQADVLARWHSLHGEDVFFLTGTDEHGVKNYKTAKEQGLSPQEFVDRNSGYFRELTGALNISNNNFIRTTDRKAHWPGVIQLWNILVKKGDIYKKKYSGNYCSGCERFVTEKDLVDGCCPNHPNLKIEQIDEENYFFRLSKYSDKIKELIKKDKLKITPEKWKNDFLSLVQDGLTDVSFSRDKKHLPWGIPVPGDDSQCLYVWPDALANYLTGIGYPDKRYKKYWPADLHVVGKDMLRFHTGIWPGMLLSAGLELPKEVIVHGFLTVNGQKISKSLGNVISPVYLADKYGADSIRYYVCRNFVFGQDGNFLEQSLVERHNSELADKLGNLVSRVSALAEKYNLEKCENKLLGKLKLKEIEKLIDNYELDKALNEVFAFVDECNEYVQKNELWKSGNKKKLYELADSIKAISILLWPFIPETCEKIAKQFGFKIKFNNIKKPLKVTKLKKADILFKKIEQNEAKTENNKINKPEKTGKIEGLINMGEVSYQEWEKLDLRVGKIEKIEDIEGADKLYKLTINAGKEKRIVCAGIKKYYKKEELKGKKVILFVNLAPRMMRGIESQGMILAAVSQDETKVSLIEPGKDAEVGSRIR